MYETPPCKVGLTGIISHKPISTEETVQVMDGSNGDKFNPFKMS